MLLPVFLSLLFFFAQFFSSFHSIHTAFGHSRDTTWMNNEFFFRYIEYAVGFVILQFSNLFLCVLLAHFY